MILTHPALTKLTFMDYLLTMLRILLRRKLVHDNFVRHVRCVTPSFLASMQNVHGSVNRVPVDSSMDVETLASIRAQLSTPSLSTHSS